MIIIIIKIHSSRTETSRARACYERECEALLNYAIILGTFTLKTRRRGLLISYETVCSTNHPAMSRIGETSC